MDNKTVYAIFSCDEWKSRSSMVLIAVADEDGLDDVYRDIKNKYYFTDDDIETYTYKEELNLNEVCYGGTYVSR